MSNPFTCGADSILVKPTAGVRRRRGSSWKMNGPPSQTKHFRSKIHQIGLVKLAPRVVRVQDDVVCHNVPTRIHSDSLVEAIEGCVPYEVGQV